MRASRRLATSAAVVALSAAAVALALYALDAGRGADAVRATLAPGDPDLAYADPLRTASAMAPLLLAGALALAVLHVLAGRRLLFGLTALWSLLALVALVLVLAPVAGPLRQWRVVPIALPIEPLNLLLAVACIASLASSILGWLLTPAGWDWLSAPPTQSLLPPPTQRG